MWIPKHIVIDFESDTTKGLGLKTYHPDFRIVSMAASWRDADGEMQSDYVEGHEGVCSYLTHIADTPLIVHNAQYELGILTNWVPEHHFEIHCDTMRLAQVMIGKSESIGLESCIRRVLPDTYHNHKQPFLEHLAEVKGCKSKDAGQYLGELPPEMLREYNILDTELTLRLYEELARRAEVIEYDWTFDHSLYLDLVGLTVKSKNRGVPVNHKKLDACIAKKHSELEDSDIAFLTKYATEIDRIVEDKVEAYKNGVKTERGRAQRAKKLEDPDTWDKQDLNFKTSRANDKEKLFIGCLGIKPKFFTASGKSPSFANAHLSSYGEGGEMLAGRGGKKIALQQAESLKKLSEDSDRWHIDINPTGTKTGRLSGGYGED